MLELSHHADPMQYWEGGNYELNLSFETLRDRQWADVLTTIWENVSLNGPLAARYMPGTPAAEKVAVQVPPPTAVVKQHGQIAVNGQAAGCDVQATRSIFECVSILVPIGMFHGLTGGTTMRGKHPELTALDEVFYDVALHVYSVAPFQVASLGYERSCQLPSELRNDGEARHNFLAAGNFLIQEAVLRTLEPDLTPYQEVRQGLYWLAARF
ncbi:MAG: hypothetical protein DYG88_01425 [Chloroflexi bacterium CFX4]|nr:hypothetical protein [Chloroflexi bacterium CFX4]MDL1921443.1 hypothetical protein [Chloroflexi bacterium CFX3]